MKFVFFTVLASLAVVAAVNGAAVETTSTHNLSSVLKSLKSTSNTDADGATTTNFFANCPDADLHLTLCINSANLGPGADACAVLRLTIDCTSRAIEAYSSVCRGADEANAAVDRLREGLDETCRANGATSVIAGLLPVLVTVILNLLSWMQMPVK